MTRIRALLNARTKEELKAIPNIVEILKLGHISNTVRTAQRQLFRTHESREYGAKGRDTVFGIVVLASYVYEGVKSCPKMINRVRFDFSAERREDIAWVNQENRNNSSFFNGSLAGIRNGLAFHFGNFINMEKVGKYAQEFPPVVISGDTEAVIDAVYPLSDEILLNSLAEVEERRTENEEKIALLFQDLVEYTNRFTDFVDDLIADLTEPHFRP